MKKLFLSITLIMAFSAITFAQKANVKRAENLILQEKADFNEARKLIKEALKDETTKNEAKTYYVAGQIGYKENEKLNQLLMLGRESDVDKDKKGAAIMESYNYLIKAHELDNLPNAKGKIKPKLTKKIRENILEYYTQQYNLIAYGAHLYENRDYAEAANVFTTYLAIPHLDIMKKELNTNDSTYLMIKYFNALALTNSKNSTEAIKAYNSLKADNYEALNVYQLLSEEYLNIKDSANYFSTLKEGFDKFPEEPWFLQNIINYYINKNDIEAAATYLNQAIDQNPNIAEYYFVKGNIDERMENLVSARAAFEKALSLKPEMAGAYAGIGRVIFNQAVEMQNKAGEIKDNNLYNAEMDKIQKVFESSLEYMEKAVELDGDEYEYKQNLKMLYYRLGDEEKYEAIVKEMEG